jgi:serine/threonine-protein kinase
MTELVHWQTPIAEGCFQVGHRRPQSLLQCNTYLRTFHGKERLHWCVDPGSQVDYPIIRKHLKAHVGDLTAIRLFSINHQDPDVVGNLTFLTRENPNLAGLTSEDTWRLVRHLNLRPKRMYYTNKVGEETLKLANGHRIQLLPTPFCHFRGAVAYYDPENQVLFTGDLFGGLNKPGRVQLYGEEADWPGIAQFHQIYMPSRLAVAFAIRQIQALRPAVKVIAPQHGFVLQGDIMHVVMDRLLKLPMGMDLLPKELDERYFKKYAEVFQEVLAMAGVQLGRDQVLQRLQRLPKTHKLHRYIKVGQSQAALARHGIVALALLVEELTREQAKTFESLLKHVTLELCLQHKVPLPQLGVGVDEGAGE